MPAFPLPLFYGPSHRQDVWSTHGNLCHDIDADHGTQSRHEEMGRYYDAFIAECSFVSLVATGILSELLKVVFLQPYVWWSDEVC